MKFVGRDHCPTCGRETIQRSGGEWCRWCVRFVEQLRASTENGLRLRVLRSPR